MRSLRVILLTLALLAASVVARPSDYIQFLDDEVSAPMAEPLYTDLIDPEYAVDRLGVGKVVDFSKPKVEQTFLAQMQAMNKNFGPITFSRHIKRIVEMTNTVVMEKNVPRGVELLAYILATGQHESAGYSIFAEIGGPKKHYAPYYGRGYVQLTWKSNYEQYNVRLHQRGLLTPSENIVTHPDILSQSNDRAFKCNALIMVDGMMNGRFTGVGLLRYITASSVDYLNARRVVNGMDRADLIAGYARAWQRVIEAARKAA